MMKSIYFEDDDILQIRLRDKPIVREVSQDWQTNISYAKDGSYLFTRDHLFSSPSMAALAVMGRSANGWHTWKSKEGKTLDEVKRQFVVAATETLNT